MTTLTVTSSIDSQMHNNIMAAGSRDRLPMLAIGRYPQWRSRFLRYIDTRPYGDALRKCIFNGPYIPTTIVVQAVGATDDSPTVPEHTKVETPMNMSPKTKAHFESEKEAIHLILTGLKMKYTRLLMLAKQLRKCRNLSKGYNKVNPSTFKMSRQTYFGNSVNSPLTMEKQWNLITRDSTS
nr:hypothetical protein [Tanacetum cinerariifolium]